MKNYNANVESKLYLLSYGWLRRCMVKYTPSWDLFSLPSTVATSSRITSGASTGTPSFSNTSPAKPSVLKTWSTTSRSTVDTVLLPIANISLQIVKFAPCVSLNNVHATRMSTGMATWYFVFCFWTCGFKRSANSITEVLCHSKHLNPLSVVILLQQKPGEPCCRTRLHPISQVIFKEAESSTQSVVIQCRAHKRVEFLARVLYVFHYG